MTMKTTYYKAYYISLTMADEIVALRVENMVGTSEKMAHSCLLSHYSQNYGDSLSWKKMTLT